LADDPSQLDQAIVVLRSLSLIQRQAEIDTLSLHRLLQTVLREHMSKQEQMLWLKRAARALNAVFPEAIYEVWRQCERLLPHVLAVTASIPYQESDQAVVAVLRKAAAYLRVRGQYKQAEPLYLRALRIGEQVLEPAHLDMALSLNGLALLYEGQGKYEQAEALHQRALHIGELVLGPVHSDLAQLLSGLAMLYWRLGKYEQAEPLYKQALSIREEIFGPEHPDITAQLNGLAFLYMEQGKGEQARLLWQRVLHIWEQTLATDHPEHIYLRNTQAKRRAEQEEEQALSIWEQVGAQYPHLAYPLYGLAVLYAREGNDKQAASFYWCALHIRDQAMGYDHHELAYPLSGLANLFLKQGKYEQAESLYQRALHLQEQQFGLQHPEVAQTLYDLAIFYQSQGHVSEALSFAERAAQIYPQFLGDAHPKTVAALVLYAQLVQETGVS
ncbi:MAG: tetratricopeptide repeat protein, partial [Ktedonobacteraceae bacterium]